MGDEFTIVWAVEEQDPHTGDWFPCAYFTGLEEAEAAMDRETLRVAVYKAYRADSALGEEIERGLELVRIVREVAG